MILAWLLIITVAGAMAAWLLERRLPNIARWSAPAALIVNLVITCFLLAGNYRNIDTIASTWLISFSTSWISPLGISFSLAADGFSLMLITLTIIVGLAAIAVSWNQISERAGFFYFNLMLTIAGIIGVFCATDLFLFYFFWELMLVPMYFMIAIWGGPRRTYVAIKFLIFTQAGGLLMLVAIAALYVIHGQATGKYTFSYDALLAAAMSYPAAKWIMLGFAVAFAVKMPIFPLHTWALDAYTEAPPAASIILAGILSKTGAYGFIRFVLPFFGPQAVWISHVAMILAVISILYCAVTAFGQTDIKRFIAYTSISHLGFILLGIFSATQLSLLGAVIIMFAHGLSITALFAIAAVIERRISTRDLNRMGGLWSTAPRLGGLATLFAMASLGLPGLGNFVGEFLVLAGAFAVNPVLASIAALGLITSVIYAVWLIYRIFQGFNVQQPISDLNLRETTVLTLLALGLLWLGFYPRPVIKMAKPTVNAINRSLQMPEKTAAACLIDIVQEAGK